MEGEDKRPYEKVRNKRIEETMSSTLFNSQPK